MKVRSTRNLIKCEHGGKANDTFRTRLRSRFTHAPFLSRIPALGECLDYKKIQQLHLLLRRYTFPPPLHRNKLPTLIGMR